MVLLHTDDAVSSLLQGFACLETVVVKFYVHLQRLSYAKGESDAVAKIKGTFVEKDKKERQKHNKIERGASCQHV